jgi:hypothetical protein
MTVVTYLPISLAKKTIRLHQRHKTSNYLADVISHFLVYTALIYAAVAAFNYEADGANFVFSAEITQNLFEKIR